jgi:arsenate reductase (glutaredoxin)
LQQILGRATLSIKIYGIKNCDTMKKALLWLCEHGVAHEFIDYKKTGVVGERLPCWRQRASWEVLLNRRGLMWKKLSEAERENVDAEKAAALMERYPALIKRPVLEVGDTVLVGFDPDTYRRILLKD